jgi:hypothetical protein
MAVARQSQPDQSVTGNKINAGGIAVVPDRGASRRDVDIADQNSA